MKLKLEQLEYQQQAIDSIISVFKGQERNTFDNACYEGIRANMLSLSAKEIEQNIKETILANGIDETAANIELANDLCIEMETGTGKTLVYIKTIFELYKHYGFSKFIILVPSVAIKEGVLNTIRAFETQLEDIYNIKPVRLINRIIEMITDKKDIILNFFVGSGTTAHTVIALNKEDGENRRFILVQLPETTNEKSEAYKAGYKKISDITIERNKRVIEKIEKEEASKEAELFDAKKEPFKTGFKVYKLAKSNFPRVDFAPNPDKSEEENIKLLNEYIDEKEAMFLSMIDENQIFDEVLLKNGFMLNYSKIQEDSFSKNTVYRIKDDFKECLICMDMSVAKETLKELEGFKDTLFICLERSLDTTMKWNLKHLFDDKLVAF